MKYPAPDGHLIESSPIQPVTYTCDIGGIEGIYESFETMSSSTSPTGLQQIKIVREVNPNSTTITITESTEEELVAYKESLVPIINPEIQ